MRNIELVLNRCHLQIEALMATPYASGLATLVDDEAQLGVAVVDFGGATTTVAVFADGHPVYCDAIAIGGHHLTLDIARQLSVSVADAERLKTVYGSVLPGQADEREMISIVPVGAGADEAPGMIPRSHLTRILRPRVEEILTAIRDRMQATGMMDVCGRRFVLTGGGSELTGLPEVARRVLARNVRNGRPMGISGAARNGPRRRLCHCRRHADLSAGLRPGSSPSRARRQSSPAPTAISPASATGSGPASDPSIVCCGASCLAVRGPVGPTRPQWFRAELTLPRSPARAAGRASRFPPASSFSGWRGQSGPFTSRLSRFGSSSIQLCLGLPCWALGWVV